MLKFAGAGPSLEMSPSMHETKLANAELNASPTSAAIKESLSMPTKKVLQDYEKHMTGHEALLKRSLTQLDKDVEAHQEQLAKEQALKAAMEARLEKKRRAREDRAEKGREAGRKKGQKMDVDSPGGDEGEDQPGSDVNQHDEGADVGEAWGLLHNGDTLNENPRVGDVEVVKPGERASFQTPTLLDRHDLPDLGFSPVKSDTFFEKNCSDECDEENLGYFEFDWVDPETVGQANFSKDLGQLFYGGLAPLGSC